MTEKDRVEIAPEEEIHLRDYVQVILKRRRIVGTFFLVVFVLVLVATLAQTPRYQATTQLLIEKNQSTPLMTQYGYTNDPFFLKTQFELIKSKNVLYRVIATLELDSKYRHYFLGDEDKGFIAATKEAVGIFFTSHQDSAAGESSLGSEDEERSPADDIASILTNNIKVQPVRDTNVINISFLHDNPIIAKKVVNAIAESYMAELLEIKMQSSSYAVKWMTEKAQEEKKKLQQAEVALQEYTRRNDLLTVENKEAIIPQQLSEYSSQLLKAKAQRNQLEELHNKIVKFSSDYESVESLPNFSENKDLQQIREKILQTEQDISELSKKFGPKHPSMIKAQEELTILKNEKKRIITRVIEASKNEYELAKQNEESFEQLLNEAKLKTLNMNEKLIQHNILQREVDSNRVLYDALLTQIKETSATEQTQIVNVFIVEKAKTPLAPETPKKARNLMLAIVLGLFGGAGMAFFIEYMDNTVSSVEDLEKRFNVPVLGVVPAHRNSEVALVDVMNKEPKSSIAESYRMIRSAITLSSAESGPKILLTTSGLPGEGKTSTSVNLAKTIALEGKAVLLIDCDLRKPTLHKVLKIRNQHGLSSYLAGIKTDNLIIRIPDLKLSVLPSGPNPPNPSELLGSARMKKMLEVLSQQFDYILLDSPPILTVTDAHILGSLAAAGTILVVRSGKTTYEGLAACLKKVQQTNMHLIGAILNGKEITKSKGYNYYYGGYYSDYYSDSAKDLSSST